MNIDNDADDHLHELETGDCYCNRPGNSHLQRLKSIIGVHEGMDQKVAHYIPPGRSDVLGVRVPGIEKNGDVMVPEIRLKLVVAVILF